MGRARLPQQAGSPKPGEHPDRHVDQENRPPPPAKQVGLGEHAAEQRTAHPGDGQDHSIQAEGAWPLGSRELDLDRGQHLRDHDGSEDPLEHPRTDQHPGALGSARKRRCEHEPC